MPKYVGTTQHDQLTWSGAKRLSGTLATAVAELKARPGGQVQMHDSGTLAQSLTTRGLIDAYHLPTFPLILGHGRRLFAQGMPPRGLRLVDSHRSGSGVTMHTYERAGAPAFGCTAAQNVA